MPHLSTLQQYPGACLIEGTNLSEGRGTALPFEIAGAPWIDSTELADQLNAQHWPGVIFRACGFLPSESKWAGETCGGVQAHVVDAGVFHPLPTWLSVIQTTRALCPADFAWNTVHFDHLMGSDSVRLALDAGASVQAIAAGWGDADQRREFLLY
ncbi:MAG: DUF1343 domain-containing protein, partial [Anaerolineae bacterium]|nr:DUF1343 domain-containing protein [Anaerolineae bacterium]